MASSAKKPTTDFNVLYVLRLPPPPTHGVCRGAFSTPLIWGNGWAILTRGEEAKYSGVDCPSTTLSTANHPQISIRSKSLSYVYGFYSRRAQCERRPVIGHPELPCTVPMSLKANILPQATPLFFQIPTKLPFSTFFPLYSSSSSLGPVSLCPGSTSALGLLYSPKHSFSTDTITLCLL